MARYRSVEDVDRQMAELRKVRRALVARDAARARERAEHAHRALGKVVADAAGGWAEVDPWKLRAAAKDDAGRIAAGAEGDEAAWERLRRFEAGEPAPEADEEGPGEDVGAWEASLPAAAADAEPS